MASEGPKEAEAEMNVYPQRTLEEILKAVAGLQDDSGRRRIALDMAACCASSCGVTLALSRYKECTQNRATADNR